jgi:hypothetical protein
MEGNGIYRARKEIEWCWFEDVQRKEGNGILLVCGCKGNGRK